MELRSFPSIDQFRHVVGTVEHRSTYIGQDAADEPMYDPSRPRPVLTFRGTTKLHGSNAGIRFELAGPDAGVYAQSRERFLVPDAVEKGGDNFGFAAWVAAGGAEVDVLKAATIATALMSGVLNVVTLHVFGEFCGPSVNRKAAVGRLPDCWFVLRALATDAAGNEHWLSVDLLAAQYHARFAIESPVERKLRFITDFECFEVTIDFNQPEAMLDHLEDLTLAVEEACPVAKALGLIGIGEGIVWSCTDPSWGRLDFKTKGRKHKGTKNSRLVQIAPEVLASRQAFADAVTTESRLEQGYDLLRAQFGSVGMTHIGAFLAWFGKDVLKEEADTLEASGLARKDVMGDINRKASDWFRARVAQD
ncbi:RNA ligase family protein [Achromobacter xylosoxidans]